eukprot:m.241966 g.241966  ORF g.241966 m.241966 type:complete len:158 (-) comp28666_c0_seq1:53-526(-)
MEQFKDSSHSGNVITVYWLTRAGQRTDWQLYDCCGCLPTERECKRGEVLHTGKIVQGMRISGAKVRQAAPLAMWDCCNAVALEARGAPIHCEVIRERNGCVDRKVVDIDDLVLEDDPFLKDEPENKGCTSCEKLRKEVESLKQRVQAIEQFLQSPSG